MVLEQHIPAARQRREGLRSATPSVWGRVHQSCAIHPAQALAIPRSIRTPASMMNNGSLRLPVRLARRTPGTRCATWRPRAEIAKQTQPGDRAILHGTTWHPSHPVHTSQTTAACLPHLAPCNFAGARPRNTACHRATTRGDCQTNPTGGPCHVARRNMASLTSCPAQNRRRAPLEHGVPSGDHARRLRSKPNRGTVPCCAAQHGIPHILSMPSNYPCWPSSTTRVGGDASCSYSRRACWYWFSRVFSSFWARNSSERSSWASSAGGLSASARGPGKALS